MKKILSLLSLLMLSIVGMNAQTIIYSWESPEGTPIETGGTIAYVNGDGDRLNYQNSGYYTICLNGKKNNVNDETASANAGKMVISLDNELAAGDEIAITAYITKNESKNSSAYIIFETGTAVESDAFGDAANIDQTFNGSPQTKIVTVPDEAAGSKTITMTRGQTGTNLFITKLVITRAGSTEVVYTVAGNNTAIFGTEWDAANAANDMVKGEDGIYTKIYEGVELTNGYKVEYKVVENHSWNESWGNNGNNADYTVWEGDGKYDVTFTFNEETKAVSCDMTKVADVFDFADPNFRTPVGEAMTDVAGYIYNETFAAGEVTLQVTAGSAPSRIYVDNNRGQNLVTYKEYTTLTFKVPEGKAIKKIEFTAAGNSNINNFTASSGAIDGMTWTGNAEGVRFLQGGTSYLANAIVTLADKDDATAALPAIEYAECANIAAFNALEAGTYAKITLTDAEIIGKSADGYSTVWVQDATGGAWIQYTSLNDRLQEGTKVNGIVYTIKRITSGNPQLKEAEGTTNSEFSSEAISAYTMAEGTIEEVNVAANLNKVVKISGANLLMTSATAGQLIQGEVTIDVNNGNATANQQLCKIANWEKDKQLENVTIVAILVAKSATANQLLPISIEQLNTYTATFTTNAGWEEVWAYTWTNGEPKVEQLGPWPGKKLEADGTGVYTVSIEAEAAPAMIIFNNGGNGEQTIDLVFENGKAYNYAFVKPGTYYLYSVAADGYVVGANNWGTRASISKVGGIAMDVVMNGGKYELKTVSTYPNKHLGFNGYVDNGDANQNWTITAVEGQEGVFTLTADDGNVLFWDGGDATTTSMGSMPETAANAYWKFVTKEEREALFANATAENPVDATFYITNPNFSRASSNAMWNDSPSMAGANENYNGEKFNTNFDVYQMLTGLKEGVYQLQLQGFYRQGGHGPAAAVAARQAGEERLLATYYAGDEEKALMSILDEAGKLDVGSDTEYGKVPNSQSEASQFMSAGYYENEPINVTVVGGTLKIGVKKSETITNDWSLFDNFRLFYMGPVPADELKGDYEKALADAQALLDNADYAGVTGEERTALEQAISDNTNVADNADAYRAAIQALETAMNTFSSAKSAYDGLVAAKNVVANLYYQYATVEKKEAAEAAFEAVATNADDATAKTTALYKAYRQYAESSALLEGVEGAVNFTSTIVNPKAEQSIAEPWVVVLGEGSGGSLTILDGQPWTDGEDNSTHKYFDGGNWGAQAWDVTMQQEIKLPKGKYQLTIKGRAAQDMKEFFVFAGESKTEMIRINDQGGLFNRGWNDASVEFEMTEAGPITIGVQGVTENQYQWMSFSDFRLMKFEAYEPVYTVAGAVKANADAEEEASFFGAVWAPDRTVKTDQTVYPNDLEDEDGDGIYTISFDDVELVPGSIIYYKVVAEHTWNYLSWGFGDNNADYVVNLPEGETLPEGVEKGSFDITFKFNPTTPFENGYNVDCVVEYDSKATGITSVAAETVNNGKIYNLKGQRVTNAQKGLYIINGNKVVIK